MSSFGNVQGLMADRVMEADSHVSTRRMEFVQESKRLATFSKTREHFPDLRVWFIRLASVGFYFPQAGGSFVRCAFCAITVDLIRFRDTDPADLHSHESPDCPLWEDPGAKAGPGAGQGARNRNVSFELQGQETARRLIEILFGATGKDSTRHPSPRQQRPNHQPGSLPVHQQPQSLTASSFQPQPQPPPQPPSVSRVPVGQHPVNQGEHNTFSLPPRSVAPPPLSAHVDADSLHNPESLPPRASGIPAGPSWIHQAPESTLPWQHQEPIRSESREPARTLQSSQPTGLQAPEPALPTRLAEPIPSQARESSLPDPPSQPMRTLEADGALPYQTARPIGQGQQGMSTAHASGQSGDSSRQLVTYRQLGIYTETPRRPDLSICSARVNTYTNADHPWPHPNTHTPVDMAQAGFYYVGLEDLVRCFYCKGGLKAWTGDLRPWVEHARHFPQCPFVGQVKGQEFIDVVQALQGTHGESFSDMEVEEELHIRESAARRTNIGQGGLTTQTEASVGGAEGVASGAIGGAEDADDMTGIRRRIEELERENKDMTEVTLCKICGENVVTILFLPCGHLVSCAQCSPVLRTCAVCRSPVKGRVRITDNNSN